MEEKHMRPGSFDETAFCRAYLDEHPMVCVDNQFFTVEGRLDNTAALERDILQRLEPVISFALAKRVHSVMDNLKVMCWVDGLPLYTDRIHVANGTLFLNGKFTPDKEFCYNRLAVNWNPDPEPAVTWHSFLSELLAPEDILTLQEYLGYCLIPTNIGQKMMILTGSGGEGKSRVGLVMSHILGAGMINSSVQKIESNSFARADLQFRLLMVDDDLDTRALEKTNYTKQIVTAEGKMDLEVKYRQSYQGIMYARLLCFGNDDLTSLHDRSYGFYRRQIVLRTLPRCPDRKDDPFLIDKLRAESEGILRWLVGGLLRLGRNNYHFTLSDTARADMERVRRENNNLRDFLFSSGYVRMRPDAEATSRNLYDCYRVWCGDNALPALSQKEFLSEMNRQAPGLGLNYCNRIGMKGRNGKAARGYRGIEVIGID